MTRYCGVAHYVSKRMYRATLRAPTGNCKNTQEQEHGRHCALARAFEIYCQLNRSWIASHAGHTCVDPRSAGPVNSAGGRVITAIQFWLGVASLIVTPVTLARNLASRADLRELRAELRGELASKSDLQVVRAELAKERTVRRLP